MAILINKRPTLIGLADGTVLTPGENQVPESVLEDNANDPQFHARLDKGWIVIKQQAPKPVPKPGK